MRSERARAVRLVRLARSALVALAALALFSRLFLILNFDRSGGVTCIWLRTRPALKWEQASSADPAASHAVSVICGNENGVEGEDLLDWNARFGWWLFSAAALALVLVDIRINRRLQSGQRADS